MTTSRCSSCLRKSALRQASQRRRQPSTSIMNQNFIVWPLGGCRVQARSYRSGLSRASHAPTKKTVLRQQGGQLLVEGLLLAAGSTGQGITIQGSGTVTQQGLDIEAFAFALPGAFGA